jgi:hypothetical protein
MVNIQNHVFGQLHHPGNAFAVGDALAGNEDKSNIAFYRGFVKVVSENAQQRIKMINMGVVDN